MKKFILDLWQIHLVQAIVYFLMGVLAAFLFTQTVMSPTESVEENVPANPVTESRGL